MTASVSAGIIHLALASYGLEPFEAFARSYQAHPAGYPHRLVVGLKGFTDEQGSRSFRTIAERIGADVEIVPDGGFDIGSYRLIAGRMEEAVICLINTRSRIVRDDWLRLLMAGLADPKVAAVGATASLQSLATDTLRPTLDRGHRSWLRRRAAWLYRFTQFPSFPNPHLRTNGFVVRRSLWLNLHVPPLIRKLDAMRFESGRNGMTRQLERLGFDVRMITSEGRSAPIAAPACEEAFWMGDQQGLLIEDNQTLRYRDAGSAERRLLATRAWHPPSSHR